MKIKHFKRILIWLVKLSLIQIIILLLCNQAIAATNSKIKFKIKEARDSIFVTAKSYSLSIDKVNAEMHLKNWQGIPYTSFPIDIQYSLKETRDISFITREWKIKANKIMSSAAIDDLVVQEFIITCYDEGFEIKISSLSNSDPTNIGAYLLRRNDVGFDTIDWDQFFSPEPDDYFKINSSVDIRVDRDQQWVFTPAPLNLSFKTAAGWFSIGLAELPDATVFGFKNKAMWLDFPWDKVKTSYNQLYRFPSLIFTFNESPWHAVGDYRSYLVDRKIISNPQEIQQPDWWHRPLVSTWGEQRVQHITYAHPDFNSSWVKEYIEQQQQTLDSIKFTLIIENKWARADGDPTPSDRFADLRKLIDWCHKQDLRVILFWKAWKVEANSLPISMGIFDGEYIDATHPRFQNYVDSCCQKLLGDQPGQLNADGLKIDYLFLTPDPAKSNYAESGNGIGIREAHRYLKAFYRTARKYKPDALIISSAIDPHFSDVQDMVRINDDWDNKTVREKRARIITGALPGILINGDAADMSIGIALYHYVTSAIYGIPSIQYLNRFHDAAIPAEMKSQILKLLKMYLRKPAGRLKFADYGNWQILNKSDEVVAESIPSGKGMLVFDDKDKATLLCIENSDLHIAFDYHRLKAVHDDDGIKIPFRDLGHGLYEIKNARQGEVYHLRLRRISSNRW